MMTRMRVKMNVRVEHNNSDEDAFSAFSFLEQEEDLAFFLAGLLLSTFAS